jgi:hypothetical protein
MASEIDSRIAENLVSSALSSLNPTPGANIICSKRALRRVFLEVAAEAHEIGFLSGRKEHFADLTRSGDRVRPAWMDIRLDVARDMAAHNVRFQPVVLKSLMGAGYRCLGDLRWVSDRELRECHYVGIRTARRIRDLIRRLEATNDVRKVP